MIEAGLEIPAHKALAAASARSGVVALWLAVVAALVLAMVVVGGATRITGSGLSITEWKPITGAIPPLGQEAWAHLFRLYQATPQGLLNHGLSMAEFHSIFWWEWGHRLLGRVLGVAFLAPFVILLAARRMPRRLVGRCVLLFALGGLQGAAGWWMVKSGLEARTSVAPERLAVHLGLALVLFSATVWTALEAWFGPGEGLHPRSRGWVWASAGFLAAVFVQCLLGALVAGNHAGLVDADWPLMGGRVFPDGYWQGNLWGTLAHSLPAVQFNHRVLAYGLVTAGLAMATTAWGRGAQPLRAPTLVIAALLVAQAALGVAALIMTVPLSLAMLHQFTAASLLAAATFLTWRVRRLGQVT
ncbi:MAG TPA: COX15/CtaA family protein [Caulobacteraceae bacterium]